MVASCAALSAVTLVTRRAGWPITARRCGNWGWSVTTAFLPALVEVGQGCRPGSGTRYGPGMPSLPAAAPLPARDLLAGPPRRARVVGVHPSCVYVVTDPAEPRLVAAETADALGLPCALRLGLDRGDRPFAGVSPGDPARVGGHRVELG